MSNNLHRMVLGVVEDIPQGLKLYQTLVDNDGGTDRYPIILSYTMTDTDEALLLDAGLTEARTIERVRIYQKSFTDSGVNVPQAEAMVARLLVHNPEVFWTLLDDFLVNGKILVALKLDRMKGTEIHLTKLILKYAIDRVHVIDLT